MKYIIVNQKTNRIFNKVIKEQLKQHSEELKKIKNYYKVDKLLIFSIN